MYPALAVVGGLVGLLVTGVAVYTAWFIHRAVGADADKSDAFSAPLSRIEAAGKMILRWTLMDYAVLLLFIIGLLFLLADLAGVLRDRHSYPLYHFGYLLCGLVFSALGMLFMFVRLTVLIRLVRSERSFSPNHHDKPSHTNHAE
jgi:hypothetical protein